MRFGGHETFHIREGWLRKGLQLLHDAPEKLVDEHAADWLGVGRNMAKSIRHWLLACELATIKGTSRKPEGMRPTALGELVHREDPYFLEIGTWWALHTNLVHSKAHALTWHWFFNLFRVGRFEKPVSLQALTRYLEAQKVRLPSPKTLDRDVSCLLSSYAKKLPPVSEDPEDALDCPMIDLGLLTHFRDSGVFELHLGSKPVPAPLVGYAMSKAFRHELSGKSHVDVGIRDAVAQTNSPGAVFALTAESLYEVVSAAAAAVDGDIEIVGLASQRAIRLRAKQNELDWLKMYYATLKGATHAA